MGHNTFFISDTHFGHKGMVEFLRSDGEKLRPWETIEEHDEAIIENWNKVVRPQDRVYHLGDVVINRRCLPILFRLNGRKKLIRGNHDIFKMSDYAPYFEDLYGVYVLKDMILSHIPLHPDCVTERFRHNVHGHLHSNVVMKTHHWDNDSHDKSREQDHRYLSVCCEHINYTPISIEEVRSRLNSGVE